MRTRVMALILPLALLGAASPLPRPPASSDRVRLALDTSEADQVLAILALSEAGKPIPDAGWKKLFATRPYQRLKERERKIGEQFHNPSLAFTDEDFQKFVLSPDLRARAPRLRDALERWKQADLNGSAERALAYLPDSAFIRAQVYPVIKPLRNSFVWDLASDPAIFMYLDPEITRGKFENTVAHELHHIGLGSLGPVYDQKIVALPERAHSAAEWMGGFGEGLAMLAAAGGPDVDPHAESTPSERAQWQSELAGFDRDLPTLDAFFSDVLSGRLAGRDSIAARASSFYGSHQGPWYTVGYRMAVLVEKQYGRPALIQTMTDYRCLLALYNQAAAERNAQAGERLPLWSESVLSEIGATTCAAPTADSK